MDEHLYKFTEICDELEMAGDPLTDKQQIDQLLMTLPGPFNPIIAASYMSPDITFARVCEQIKHMQEIINFQEEPPKLLLATDKPQQYEKRQWNQRGRDRGRGRWKSMRGKPRKQGQQSFKRSEGNKCEFCDRFGHNEEECLHKKKVLTKTPSTSCSTKRRSDSIYGEWKTGQ